MFATKILGLKDYYLLTLFISSLNIGCYNDTLCVGFIHCGVIAKREAYHIPWVNGVEGSFHLLWQIEYTAMFHIPWKGWKCHQRHCGCHLKSTTINHKLPASFLNKVFDTQPSTCLSSSSTQCHNKTCHYCTLPT